MNIQDMQTIRGYVQSLPKRPGREEAARVAVIADDGTRYHVLHKGAGASLVANINANVEITGSVASFSSLAETERSLAGVPPEDADESEYLLTVKSYRLTDGFDDPWYDDAAR